MCCDVCLKSCRVIYSIDFVSVDVISLCTKCFNVFSRAFLYGF